MTDPVIAAMISAAVALAVSVAGTLATHSFTRRRDRENAARQRAVECMVSVFRTLLAFSNNDHVDQKLCDDLRLAVGDIQLFGSKRQVELTSQMVEALAAGRRASFDTLLESLRDTLREQLELQAVGPRPVTWVQLRAAPKQSSTATSNPTGVVAPTPAAAPVLTLVQVGHDDEQTG